jgi:hypothetical protein
MTEQTLRFVKSLAICCLLSIGFFFTCFLILKEAFPILKYIWIALYLCFSALTLSIITRKLLKGKQLFTYHWSTFLFANVPLVFVSFLTYCILGIDSNLDLLVFLMISFEAIMIMSVLLINGAEIVLPWRKK